LIVDGQQHRLTEVECYYRSADHPDPFPHADPIQHQKGLWYFHKTSGEYRGGTYKGVDLAFGDNDGTGGLLIRSIETPQGKLIDGPSLTVDHLLARTGCATVAELDRAISGRPAWNAGNPLRLVRVPSDGRAVFRSARVGLSLRRAAVQPEALRFVMRPYRFLTEPRRIKKGKTLLLLQLHLEGRGIEEISHITGSPPRSIQRAIESCEAGLGCDSFDEFIGNHLTPLTLSRLQGAWQVRYGKAQADAG
jgi:hypothetical protein